MTAEQESMLRTLEARVTQLALDYKALSNQCEALKHTVAQRDEVIAQLKIDLDKQKSEYAHLKTARMIDISSTDMKDAKLMLSRLVREVDKCIALLNA